MTKENFKDRWRDIEPGTDEHFSTQSTYIVMNTIRKNNLHKSQMELGVIKDVMAAYSYFRRPTEHTGGNDEASGFELGHPRGDKKSVFIASKKSPGHSAFDIVRRTLAYSAGEEEANKTTDGTGILLSMLYEAVKITTNLTGSPGAKGTKILSSASSAEKKEVFETREDTKTDLASLRGKRLRTQPFNASQYNGSSPAASSFVTDVNTNRKRSSSTSPSRKKKKTP